MTAVASEGGRLRLDVFEGPLDLLLYLIRKNEIEIHDIPIAEITTQYQAMLEHAQREGLLDLDFAGDYFLLAATLIQIKTRMLLPRPAAVDGAPPPEDPRAELVRQLLEYERFREAAMMLHERGQVASTMLLRPEEAVRDLFYGGETTLDADLLALARAFQKVMEERRLRTPHVLAPSRYTVRDRMRMIVDLLLDLPSDSRRITFRGLFEVSSVEQAVATFLALLELVRRDILRCRQANQLADIELELAVAPEEAEAALRVESEFDRPRPLEGEETGADEVETEEEASDEADSTDDLVTDGEEE